MQENDPDTLQLLDESDIEWVNLWLKAAKLATHCDDITFFVPALNEEQKHNSK